MRHPALRFWGSAILVALLFSAATALLLPYDALRLWTEPERWRAWLLTMWTGGVLAVLFGLSGLFGVASPLGFREVAEAGSVMKAMETRHRARSAQPAFYQNFAWWLVFTGLMLIVVYFAAWSTDLRFPL